MSPAASFSPSKCVAGLGVLGRVEPRHVGGDGVRAQLDRAAREAGGGAACSGARPGRTPAGRRGRPRARPARRSRPPRAARPRRSCRPRTRRRGRPRRARRRGLERVERERPVLAERRRDRGVEAGRGHQCRARCCCSLRTPANQTTAMPSTAPGIASSAVSRFVSSWPGTEPRLTISPKSDGADQRAEERADDPAPEAVGQEHREVPQRQAGHDPHEQPHQRGLPCLRLRGLRGFGSSAGGSAGRRPRRRRAAWCRRSPRARARRPPAGRDAARAAAAGSRAPASSMPRLATMSSNSARETPCDGSCGVVTSRRPPRGSDGATSTGPPCAGVA